MRLDTRRASVHVHRVAIAPDTGITQEELALSGRNHSLPLEALRYDITPVGMHYLLTYFDIPHVEEATWRLEVGGLVARPLSLSLADVRARPARTLAVTLECAGNGRALMEPRPMSHLAGTRSVGYVRYAGPEKPSSLLRFPGSGGST